MLHRHHFLIGILALCGAFGGMTAGAERAPFENPLAPDGGKLPLTAGFNDVDGVGGAGLVPWALISGYGTRDSWGANAHYTQVQLRDFRLRSFGMAVGALDRFEISAVQDQFDVKGTALNGLSVGEHVLGLKVRLFGDAVYGQDSWIPQTAVGLEYKRNTGISDSGRVGLAGLVSTTQLGARSNSGIDYYLNATKVMLAQSVLVNVTLRYTKANQFGLLGFGGDRSDSRAVEFESTLAYIITRKLATGLEYRARPSKLSVDDERGAWDAFLAWTPTRNVSIVGAYVSLGSILAPVTQVTHDQRGAYVSMQVGF
jgi:hypothetical protein